MEVYDYAERVTTPGFAFMNTPGYDPVSLTGLAAGGCNLIAFTTGRGSAIGFPTIPVFKIATNSHTFRAHDRQHGSQRRAESRMAKQPLKRWAAKFSTACWKWPPAAAPAPNAWATRNSFLGASARSCSWPGMPGPAAVRLRCTSHIHPARHMIR